MIGEYLSKEFRESGILKFNFGNQHEIHSKLNEFGQFKIIKNAWVSNFKISENAKYPNLFLRTEC
jgi:hypothetical protein